MSILYLSSNGNFSFGVYFPICRPKCWWSTEFWWYLWGELGGTSFLPVDDLNFIFTSMYCCWFQVPYKNGNNKQPKPSPNLDHEYAEPIKPSTKSDPHYKVRFFLTTCWTLLSSRSPPFWQWVVSQEKACSQSDLWFGINSFVNPSQC